MRHEQDNTVVDAIICTDGHNPDFFSYIPAEIATQISLEGGLSCSDSLILRETEERPVPNCVKEGLAQIVDVLVKLEPSKEYCLNKN